MTLEELLNASADDLDKLSADELNKYFSQFFPTTRPELARKTIQDKPSYVSGGKKHYTEQMSLPKLSSEQQQHLAKLAEMGIDISFASHPVRKRR